jgi:hypothetical protein
MEDIIRDCRKPYNIARDKILSGEMEPVRRDARGNYVETQDARQHLKKQRKKIPPYGRHRMGPIKKEATIW